MGYGEQFLPFGVTDNFASIPDSTTMDTLIDIEGKSPQPWLEGNPYEPTFAKINTIAPYFKMESRNDAVMPNVNGLKPNTADYPGLTMLNSGLLGNLNSGIIVSTFFR